MSNNKALPNPKTSKAPPAVAIKCRSKLNNVIPLHLITLAVKGRYAIILKTSKTDVQT
jgi:hypothetical protein